jgi:hypothetical protein
MSPLPEAAKRLAGEASVVGVEGHEFDFGGSQEQVQVANAFGAEPGLNDDGQFDDAGGRATAMGRRLDGLVECPAFRFVLKDGQEGGGIYDYQRGRPLAS